MTVLDEISAASAVEPTGFQLTFHDGDVQRFARIIGNIGRAVSSDVQRGLDCVKIHRDQDTIIFEACDSYRAVVVTFPASCGTILPRLWSEPIYVNGKQLVKAAKMIGRKTSCVTVNVSEKILTVETDMGSANVDLTMTVWPPSLGTVLAASREDHYPCGDQQMEAPVDAALLSDLLSIIAKICGTAQPKVRLTGVGQKADKDRPTSAWRWIAEQDDVTVESVIMGLR